VATLYGGGYRDRAGIELKAAVADHARSFVTPVLLLVCAYALINPPGAQACNSCTSP
jgi:hypothetical protein